MSHKLSSQEDITNFPAPIKAIFKMSHKLWEDDQILETCFLQPKNDPPLQPKIDPPCKRNKAQN